MLIDIKFHFSFNIFNFLIEKVICAYHKILILQILICKNFEFIFLLPKFVNHIHTSENRVKVFSLILSSTKPCIPHKR